MICMSMQKLQALVLIALIGFEDHAVLCGILPSVVTRHHGSCIKVYT